MTFEDIDIFIYVADTENITGAARILNASESALSKTIRRIEAEIGFPLFDRIGNRIRLNKDGQNAYDIFSNIKQQMDLLMHMHDSKEKEVLHIYSTDIALLHNLSEYISSMDKENRYLSVDSLTNTSQLIQAYNQGICDLSATLNPIKTNRNIYVEKYLESLVVVCLKGSIKANEAVYINETGYDTFLAFGKGSPISVIIDLYTKSVSLDIRVLYQIDSMIFMTKLINSNIPAIMTKTAARKLDRDRFDVIDLKGEGAEFLVYITALEKYKDLLSHHI